MHYLDAPGQRAASSVAAGVVNPLTGRRFHLSWRMGELLEAARDLYPRLERELGEPLWYDLPLLRTLHDAGNRNDWSLREADDTYLPYLVTDEPPVGRLVELMRPVYAFAGIRQTARVDLPRLVGLWRDRLRRNGLITESTVNYDRLRPTGTGWTYTGRAFDRVICCEGWLLRFNPFFGHLPHRGNKGEILRMRTPTLPQIERMVKNRIFLVPQTDGSYWVGATNRNQFPHDEPTEDGRGWLTDQLDRVLRVPYRIDAHESAVRPTTKDRRPLVGEHPGQSGLYIFNGLGSKGASLAPLCSKWLLELLEYRRAPPAEVNVARFLTN